MTTNLKRWQKISDETVHQNPWFCVRQAKVVRPDGIPGDFFVVDTPGPAVFTLGFNDADELCLVRQHRFTTDECFWELPGGNAGSDRDLLHAAQREFEEETGFVAKEWKEIGKWSTQNGLCSEFSHIFLARGLSRSKKEYINEDGIEEVRFFAVPKVLEMIKTNEMTDGQAIAGLMIALSKLGKLA